MTLFQRDSGDDLFAIGGEEYLQRFNVRCYLSDMVRQLLECRDERPLEFISEYFLSVHRGTHMLHRSYEYVLATHHNRAAFWLMLKLAFQSQDFPGELSLDEFTQLCFLICPDLPLSMLTAVHTTMTAMQSATLTSLVNALGVRVCYAEFFAELEGLSVPEGSVSKKTLLVETLCIQGRPRRDMKAKDGSVTDAEPLHGKQPPVFPSKDVLQAVLKAVADRSTTSDRGDAAAAAAASTAGTGTGAAGSEGCTMEQILFELYTSPAVHASIYARHSSLFAPTTGVPSPCQPTGDCSKPPQTTAAFVDSVLQAHDSLVVSGRRRRPKPSYT